MAVISGDPGLLAERMAIQKYGVQKGLGQGEISKLKRMLKKGQNPVELVDAYRTTTDQQGFFTKGK